MADKFNMHGGFFSPPGYMRIDTGGSHDENPYGGVQIGVDAQGIPNMLEQEESVYKDYVFSDNIKANLKFLQENHLPEKFAGKLYSEIADYFIGEAEDRPLDAVSNNGLNAMLVRLANAQEAQKQSQQQAELEKELEALSPEELEQLDAMLSQQEDAVAQEQEVQQSEVAPEEIAQEQGMIPQMMTYGGLLNHKFEDGGDTAPAQKHFVSFRSRITDPSFAYRDATRTPLTLDNGMNIERQFVYGTPEEAEAARQERIEQAQLDNSFTSWIPWNIPGQLYDVGLDIAAGEPGWAAVDAFSMIPVLGSIGKGLKTAAKAKKLSKGAKKIIKAAQAGYSKGFMSKLFHRGSAAEEIIKNGRKAAKYEERLAEVRKRLNDAKASVEDIKVANQAALDAASEAGKKYNESNTALKQLLRRQLQASNPETLKKINKHISSTAEKMVELQRQADVKSIEKANTKALNRANDAVRAESKAYNKVAKKAGQPLVDVPEKTHGFAVEHPGVAKALRGSKYALFPMPTIPMGVYRAGKEWNPVLRWGATLGSGFGAGMADYAIYNKLIGNASSEESDYNPTFSIDDINNIDLGSYGNVEAGGGNINRYELGTTQFSIKKPLVVPTGNIFDTGALGQFNRFNNLGYVLNQNQGKKIDEIFPIQPLYQKTKENYDLFNSSQLTTPTYSAFPKGYTMSVNGLSSRNPDVSKPKVDTGKQITQDTTTLNNRNGFTPTILPTWPRYTGAITSGIIGLYNAFQKPDRYRVKRNNPTLVSGRMNLVDPTFNPIDQEQAVNSVLAANAGTMRELRNSGVGPGTIAAMIAADYNAGRNLGAARTQVVDANNQQRNNVIAQRNANAQALANFNLGIESANAQALNSAQQQNIQNDLMRQRLNYAAEGEKYAAIQSNIAALSQALSGIGQENFAMNQINGNSYYDYSILPDGSIRYYPRTLVQYKEDKEV